MTDSPELAPEKSAKTEKPPFLGLTSPESSPDQVIPGIGIQPSLPGLQGALVGIQQTQVWQGQFPPPDAIERYEAILPGAFERIIIMAEKQQAAAIAQMQQANTYRRADIQRAHYLGAAIAFAAMMCSLITLRMGYPWVAGAFLSVPVLSVTTAILGTIRPKPDRVSMTTPSPTRRKNDPSAHP